MLESPQYRCVSSFYRILHSPHRLKDSSTSDVQLRATSNATHLSQLSKLLRVRGWKLVEFSRRSRRWIICVCYRCVVSLSSSVRANLVDIKALVAYSFPKVPLYLHRHYPTLALGLAVLSAVPFTLAFRRPSKHFGMTVIILQSSCFFLSLWFMLHHRLNGM